MIRRHNPRVPANAPEDNAEQVDAGQAQDIADQAMNAVDEGYELSEHGGRPNPAAVMPDDVPDLIDKMNEMVSSGRIDMDAFAGEPMHDDDAEALGDTDDEGDDLAD